MSNGAAMDSAMCAQTCLVLTSCPLQPLPTSWNAEELMFPGASLNQWEWETVVKCSRLLSFRGSIPGRILCNSQKVSMELSLFAQSRDFNKHPYIGFYSFPILFSILFHSCCQESPLKHRACTQFLIWNDWVGEEKYFKIFLYLPLTIITLDLNINHPLL